MKRLSARRGPDKKTIVQKNRDDRMLFAEFKRGRGGVNQPDGIGRRWKQYEEVLRKNLGRNLGRGGWNPGSFLVARNSGNTVGQNNYKRERA
jgi:hypothetical protein